jgi:hypothetical protein
MRAQTITTISRRRRRARWRRALALALGACALALPASASAEAPHGADYSSLNPITGGASDPIPPIDGWNYNIIDPPMNAPEPPAVAPGALGGDSTDAADGFNWASAAVGAGAAMALVALGGAALLTVRRRTGVSPTTASLG